MSESKHLSLQQSPVPSHVVLLLPSPTSTCHMVVSSASHVINAQCLRPFSASCLLPHAVNNKPRLMKVTMVKHTQTHVIEVSCVFHCGDLVSFVTIPLVVQTVWLSIDPPTISALTGDR